MGGCGSDLLEKLGPQFGKLVACQKGKDFLDQKVRELKDNVFKQSQNIKQDTLSKINQQEGNVLQQVRKAVADIDKQSPGTLDKAASLQRKTKQSVLGADDIRSKFDQLSRTVQNQFQEKQKQIVNQIDGVSRQQKQNIDAQRPRIPIYDQLPESQQKKVFAQGEKRFKDQIKGQQDAIQKQIQSNLNINKYTDMFKSVQSDINVEGITKSATDIISTAKRGISGTSLFC